MWYHCVLRKVTYSLYIYLYKRTYVGLCTNRPVGIRGSYQPLHKVADTTLYYQHDEIFSLMKLQGNLL